MFLVSVYLADDVFDHANSELMCSLLYLVCGAFYTVRENYSLMLTEAGYT